MLSVSSKNVALLRGSAELAYAHPMDLPGQAHPCHHVPVHLPVMHLQTLLRCEGRLASLVLTQERLHAQVNEQVLLQVRVLREVLLAVGANVLLLLLMNLLDVAIQGVLGAQDHLTLGKK